MSGYTVTLTDAEYDALKARIAALEAALTDAVHYLNDCTTTDEDECINVIDRLNVVLGIHPSVSRRTAETPDAMHARIVTETADAIAKERGLTAETKGDANVHD